MNRRNFFQKALISLTGLMAASKVFASECKVGAAPAGKKVAADGERLDYQSNSVNAKAHAKFVAGSSCGNCKFYKSANAEGGYAPCAMMANKYVSECGWCKSYVALKK